MASKSSLRVDDVHHFSKLPATVVEHEIVQLLANTPHELTSDAVDENCTARLKKVIQEVSKRVVGRDDAILAVTAALACGVPSVLLGPPGTAKSMIAREISLATGLRSSTEDEESSEHHSKSASDADDFYFEYLLTAHTMPEELFGPIDLVHLGKGELRRSTRGMLPRAHLVFLDEVFRGSSQILNTLLSILNEHRFHDGRKAVPVPLVGVIAASNEPPANPDLQAFYDRFPIRIWLESALDEQKVRGDAYEARMVELIELSRRNELERQLRRTIATPPRIACLNDFRCVRARIVQNLAIAEGTGSQESEFRQLFRDLRLEAELSDRSLYSIRKFATALECLGMDASDSLRKAFLYVVPTSERRREIEGIVNERLLGRGPTSRD